MFRHPNYYKELRKRNKTDQVISPLAEPVAGRRAPGPGPKQQAIDETVPHCDIEEATSHKLPGPRPISNANKGLIHRRQASSAKLKDPQATSDKHQAPRHKRQA